MAEDECLHHGYQYLCGYNEYMNQSFKKCKNLMNEILSSEDRDKNKQSCSYAMNLLACCAIKTKQESQAFILLRRCISFEDEVLFFAIFNLGLAFFRCGKIQPAIQAFEIINSRKYNALTLDIKCFARLVAIALYASASLAVQHEPFKDAEQKYQNLLNFLISPTNLSINLSNILPSYLQIKAENSFCISKKSLTWDIIISTIQEIKFTIFKINNCKSEAKRKELLNNLYFGLTAVLNYLKTMLLSNEPLPRVEGHLQESLQTKYKRTCREIYIKNSVKHYVQFMFNSFKRN